MTFVSYYSTAQRSTTMPSPSPSTSPLPLCTLLLAEAALKFFSGTFFLVSPSTILSRFSLPPHAPVATLLTRLLGTQTLAFAVPLFLAGRMDVGGRGVRVVYWACLARETFLTVGLVGSMIGMWVGEKGEGVDERDIEEGQAGEKRGRVEDRVAARRMLVRGMGWWVAELVPFVVGRAWVLGWKGAWFD